MHLRFILATYVLLGLAFAVPFYFARQLEGPRLSYEALFTWLVVAYGSVKLSLLAVRGEKRILSLTFWVFVYIWLGVAPMLQLLVHEFPLAGFYSRSIPLAATMVILVGLVAFELGYKLSVRDLFFYRAVNRAVFKRIPSLKRTIIVGVVSTAIAIILVGNLGGISGLFVARSELSQQILELLSDEGKSGFLLFHTFLRVPVFISFYVFLYRWVHYRRRLGPRESPLCLVMLIVVGIANLVINNPINSPRYWFGTIVISTLFVVMPWKRNYSLSLLALACVLLLLVIFPYADVFRSGIDPGRYAGREWNPVTEKSDYDAFQQVMNTLVYVEENGHTFGRQLLGAICFWVPRGVWLDKPFASGHLVGANAGYRSTNLSLPLWGEAYIDGGVPGVIGVFLLYGFYLGKLERAYSDRKAGSGTFVGLLVPLFAAYQFFFLRGALMSAIAYLVPMVGMLLLETVKPRSDGEAVTAIAADRASGVVGVGRSGPAWTDAE